jgi:regulator of sigma E protease
MPLLTLLAGFGEWLGSFASSLSFWALAIIGIGLVVFVHEAGHFLVAKHYRVRVEIFSLGFGPRLFGWKRGDTDYRVSLVPIGGYVKMAGDNPGESLQGDGGELPSKSVGQRFAIFSAGVVMNLIFAVVVLPIVLAVGVQFHSTRIGGVTPGGPAWLAGIAKGDEVVSIGGHPAIQFDDLVAEVALAGPDKIEVEIAREGAAAEGNAPRPTEKLLLQPEYDKNQGRYVIGVSPATDPNFEVEKGGPAERAGFRTGDVVVRYEGQPVASIEEFARKAERNHRDRVTLGVLGADGSERELVVEPRRASQAVWLVGIEPWLNRVRAVRGRAVRPGFVQPGDELLAVERADAAPGSAAVLAPVRDAEELADAFELAGRETRGARLLLRRGEELVRLPLPADADRELARDVALSTAPTGRRVRLINGYPAALAGLPDGAEIVKVKNYAVSSWAEIKERIEKASPKPADDARADPIEIVAELDGIQHTVLVTPKLERLPVDFGLLLEYERVTRSYPFLEAVRVGVTSAASMIKNVYLTLKRMLSRDVSPSNLSGILTIAYVSRSLAEAGWPTLFYFLAVLSLNLAFLNLLPIPVLDGGHLFFLIVEKVKGSPVSEKVMGFSQLVGIVLVLALLLFVTYTDIQRIFP